MKKALSLILVLVMICSFAACGNKNNSTPDKNPAIVEYMEKNGDQLLSAWESMFEASGMTCNSSWTVKGNGLIVDIRINELDDLDDEMKEQMEAGFSALESTFDGSLKDIQKDIPELEYFTMNFCEKDGDILGSVTIDE